MSEVFVGYGDSAGDTATLVLAEADKQGLHPEVVRSVEGGFYVPEEVAKAAGVTYQSEDEVAQEAAQKVAPADDKPAAKKAAPRKRAPAKKAAAKKATKSASRRK